VTWRRWQAYRVVLAEEFVLGPERAAIARERAEEDAKFRRSSEALRRVK